MPAGSERDWRFLGLALCGAGFVITLAAFWPGMMSPDSVANLASGRTGEFHDIHAPLMSWVWGTADRVWPGPASMLIFHNLMFWTGSGVLVWQAGHSSAGRAVGLGAIGFAPHIIGQLGVIWKDVALAGALLLATGLIYWAWNTGRKWPLGLAVLFLFYGAAARLNAAAAVAPLAFWLGYSAVESAKYRGDPRAAVVSGIVLLAVLTFGAFAVNRYLTGGASTFPMQLAYLYDLAAISRNEGRSLFPEYVNGSPGFSMDQVNGRYNTRSVNDLVYDGVPSATDRAVLPLTDDEAQARELAVAWRSAVAGHPLEWAMHRASVFAQLIGLRPSVTAPYWEQGFAGSPAEFRGSETVPHRVMMAYLGLFQRPFAQTFFFRGFLWLGVAALLLYRALKSGYKGDTALVLVLTTSALAYAASFIFITPSTEFRYLLWPAVASAVAIVIALTRTRPDLGREHESAVI